MRFSTPEQAKGRSEDRQNSDAEAYATRHGMELDVSLKMADRGLSAYNAENLTSGALGAFLKKVNDGKVARGSVLVVENIDRITRLDFWKAFDIVSSIIRAGIKIHTTSPEMTYDESSATNGQIYALVGQINLAHSESSKKASRLGDAWAAKKRLAREDKTVVTKRCPAWLEKVGKGESAKLGQIENAVKTIRMIFDLAPKLGRSRLVKLLNENAPWTPPGAN
jgi:DNA invertase Pin-like site-specific DNA recombinase